VLCHVGHGISHWLCTGSCVYTGLRTAQFCGHVVAPCEGSPQREQKWVVWFEEDSVHVEYDAEGHIGFVDQVTI